MNKKVQNLSGEAERALLGLLKIAEGAAIDAQTSNERDEAKMRARSEAREELARLTVILSSSAFGAQLAARAIASKGGRSTSEAKLAAARRNGFQPKPKPSEQAMAIAAELRMLYGREPSADEIERFRASKAEVSFEQIGAGITKRIEERFARIQAKRAAVRLQADALAARIAAGETITPETIEAQTLAKLAREARAESGEPPPTEDEIEAEANQKIESAKGDRDDDGHWADALDNETIAHAAKLSS